LSKDHAYHILDTDQVDALDGNNFVLVEEEEEMKFDQSGKSLLMPSNPTPPRPSKKSTMNSNNANQVKIPVIMSQYHHSGVVSEAPKSSMMSTVRSHLPTEEDLEKGDFVPDFKGNL
jgi:hypothetical protein